MKAIDKNTYSREHISYLLSRMGSGVTQEEFAGVARELRNVTNDLVDHVFDRRYQAPPLFELYWRERCTFYGDKPWSEERARLNCAMQRDITPMLHEQVRQRRKYGGNVVLEFSGPTGMGKSSAMLGFAERHNGLRKRVIAEGVDALRLRLGIDIGDIPGKLEQLDKGDVIMLDEQLSLVGENSETHLQVLRNCEETLRGTMIDLHFASPTTRDHSTSQGVLVAISNSPIEALDGSPGDLATKFLYFLTLMGEDAIPLGTVTLPWCSPETFAAYTIIKNENLERTKKFQFHSSGEVNQKILNEMFGDDIFLLRIKGKTGITKKEWSRYVKAYAHSMSIAEMEATAAGLEEMTSFLTYRGVQTFLSVFGFEPPPGMIKAFPPRGAAADDIPRHRSPASS